MTGYRATLHLHWQRVGSAAVQQLKMIRHRVHSPWPVVYDQPFSSTPDVGFYGEACTLVQQIEFQFLPCVCKKIIDIVLLVGKYGTDKMARCHCLCHSSIGLLIHYKSYPLG